MLSAAIKFYILVCVNFIFQLPFMQEASICLEYCVSLKHLFLAPLKIVLKVIFNESSISIVTKWKIVWRDVW